MRPSAVMTIAGSDSGAGAGIQADLKTFAAHGVYGTSAITAITAQNTTGVLAIYDLPISIITDQIDAILEDIEIDSVKTGMLSSTQTICAVAGRIVDKNLRGNLVVDPVMIAKGGDRLLKEDAIDALRTQLVPLAKIVTPNVPEAEALTGRTINSLIQARAAAGDIVHGMGARAVVVKGGHMEGAPIDVFYDGHHFHELFAKRIDTTSTHGTGCTFASAIAAYLARGFAPLAATKGAKRYVTRALQNDFPLGMGHGPLNHFYRLWHQLGQPKQPNS